MAVTQTEPDLTMVLSADPFAPRLARQALGELDSPSPDLRDAIVLLASNLVTRACRQAGQRPERIEVRAWMPRSLVRVEVHAAGPLMSDEGPGEDAEPDHDRDLMAGLADRWGTGPHDGRTLVWFEIDRLSPRSSPTAALRQPAALRHRQ